jgi:hypothetical protein
MLKAISEGETDTAVLAALADKHLRATPQQLCDALGACTQLNPVYRRLLKLALEELDLIDDQIGRLDREMASLLCTHQDAVQRLAEVPGLGVDSAQQIIAEGQPPPLHPTAAVLRSPGYISCAEGTRNHRPGIRPALALPQLWWTDGGHRTTYRSSNPTPFSTTVAHNCDMKPLLHHSKTLHGSPRSAPVCPAPDLIPTSRPLFHRFPISILLPTLSTTSTSASVSTPANFNTSASLHSMCIRTASAAPAASF